MADSAVHLEVVAMEAMAGSSVVLPGEVTQVVMVGREVGLPEAAGVAVRAVDSVVLSEGGEALVTVGSLAAAWAVRWGVVAWEGGAKAVGTVVVAWVGSEGSLEAAMEEKVQLGAVVRVAAL